MNGTMDKCNEIKGQGQERYWVQGHIKVTFLAPPPALWLALSKDPTLDLLSQLSRTVSIFNKKAEQFIAV